MKPKDYEALLPTIELGDCIPRSIYQIFLGKSLTELDPQIQKNVVHLQQHNQGWSYELFDEVRAEDFIRKNYNQEILRYYKMISPKYRAAQSDFFRYLLIYRCGGVYMDIKATTTTPLDEVLDPEDKYILYHWNNDPGAQYEYFGYFADLSEGFPFGEYPQGFIISTAGHPILRAVILETMKRLDTYSPFTTGVGLMGVLRTTGPIMYSQTIRRTLPSLPDDLYREIRCAECLGLKISIFDDEGVYAHRSRYTSYHKQLSSVSLNGYQILTQVLYPYFWGRWAWAICKDKLRYWREARRLQA